MVQQNREMARESWYSMTLLNISDISCIITFDKHFLPIIIMTFVISTNGYIQLTPNIWRKIYYQKRKSDMTL